jgi:hypothetical protein
VEKAVREHIDIWQGTLKARGPVHGYGFLTPGGEA